MNKNVIFSRYASSHRMRISVLSVLWGTGLALGIVLARTFYSANGPYLQSALVETPVPFLYFFTAFAPVGLLVFALTYRIISLCYPLFLAESICRGFCGMLLFYEFGSGAWLIRILFLFSSSCVSVLMWWLLLRHIAHRGASFFRDVWLVSVVISLVCLLDIFAISPYLIRLF